MTYAIAGICQGFTATIIALIDEIVEMKYHRQSNAVYGTLKMLWL